MYITDFAKRKVLSLITDTDDCIEYPIVNRDGYGIIQGHSADKHKLHMLAHRISYQLFTGEDISSNELICHHCDNPSCINPKHLFKGTDKDNSDDKCRKKRQAKGKTHGSYIDGRASDMEFHHVRQYGKLTPQQVLEIRELRKRGETIESIAKTLNVSVDGVKGVSCGRVYKNI